MINVRSRIAACAALVILVAPLGCNKSSGSDSPVAIPVPAVSGAEPAVVARIREVTSELQSNRTSARAWGQLGAVLDAHGFDREAVTCYTQAGRLEPSQSRWPYLAGTALLEVDPSGAVAHLERAIALEPDSALYRHSCGDALAAAGRDDQAKEHYQQALRIDPAARRAILGLGELALKRDDLETARVQLVAAAELEPCDREVHAQLARTYRRLGDDSAAEHEALLVQAFPNRAAVHDPARAAVGREAVSAKARTTRALAHVDAGRFIAAERELRLAIETRPDNVQNRLNLGGSLLRQGRIGEAVSIFEETLVMAPSEPQVHNNLAVALTDVGQLARARDHIEQAIALNATYDEALFNLGRLEVIQGRLDRATVAFQRALELNPVNVPAHNELGRLLLRQGRIDDAMRHWRQAIEFGCNHPEATVNLAMVQAGRGEFGAAVEGLRTGLNRHPHHVALLSTLATILATCPDVRYRSGIEAVTIARRLVDTHGPQHVPSLNLLAAGQAEMGDFAGAVASSRRALHSAQRQGDPALVELVRSRLALYENGRPYHQGGRNTRP